MRRRRVSAESVRRTGGKSEGSGHDRQEEKLWGKGGRVEMGRNPPGEGVRIMGGDGSML